MKRASEKTGGPLHNIIQTGTGTFPNPSFFSSSDIALGIV
jgi:hypothetical protein